VNFNCTVIIEIKCTIVRHLQTFRIKNYATVRFIFRWYYRFFSSLEEKDKWDGSIQNSSDISNVYFMALVIDISVYMMYT
jgi:hypothetical protein